MNEPTQRHRSVRELLHEAVNHNTVEVVKRGIAGVDTRGTKP